MTNGMGAFPTKMDGPDHVAWVQIMFPEVNVTPSAIVFF
jgi:hypothetical protein